MKKGKFNLLYKGILFDAIGFASSFIPIGGTIFDFFWAPYAAVKMNEMYDGTSGKVASFIVFVEEILPFDFIPTFTLMWIYTYVLNGKKDPVPQTIEVKVNE